MQWITRFQAAAGRWGLWAGLAAAVAAAATPPPAGIPHAAWVTAGVTLCMALWWVTEALPLAATALVPVAVLPLLGVMPLERVAGAYGNPLIFLFLGGFLIARAMEATGLHRRVAMAIIRRAGRDPRAVIGAFMAATAFLSLWISNTAAAMVMAPVAASVAASREDRSDGFAPALLLGTAFAATIGGMGSIIGTPPNALFAGYMREAHGVEIGFAGWMAVGLPVVAVLLPLAWVMLTRVSFRIAPGGLAPVAAPPGPASPAERRVAMVAGAAALGWILRPAVQHYVPGLALSDAGIAVAAGLALFAVPSGEGGRLLSWPQAAELRWDVLILFGGGLALAAAIADSGLAAWIGGAAERLHGLPAALLIAGVAVVIVYLGELASNTAMAAIFLPIAGAAALGLGMDPVAFTLPVALAASIGFMLPVATPPNAIVLAHPSVTAGAMLRAGAPLDLIGLFVALAAGMALGPLVF
ncbi:MAG TPA: DASS family sodium-coupled anion symporter [Thermohalobaculum sp.]|nr:DASS family sodium-coupled anion symporter [Thermohalobaculum sp.]